MTRTRRLALLALLAFTTPGVAQNNYGPSWMRPEKARPGTVADTRTALRFGDDGDPIGVEVRMWGDVGDIQKGHTYRLMYQLRVQEKGKLGPLLGDANRPTGVAFTVKTAVADDTWNGLEARVDITRSALSAMTGLPRLAHWGSPVVLRVEPQLYDVTAEKFVSVGKPNCLFLALQVTGGKVMKVLPLHKWLSASCGKIADDALATLAKLDAYDPGENQLQDFFFDVLLGRVTMQHSDSPAVVKAIPVELLKSNAGKYLDAYLEKIVKGTAKGTDDKPTTFSDEVKAAAKAKLAEK